MLRSILIAARVLRPISTFKNAVGIVNNSSIKNFCSLTKNAFPLQNTFVKTSLLCDKRIIDLSKSLSPLSVRTVTKFSLQKGKRKTVRAALRRFFRLHWGGWIRTQVGRHKHMWKKSSARRRRLRQHQFCNGTQTVLLDKMVTKFWKKPKYYVDDPYAPYHTREEFRDTRKKPQ